jgi:hypothetical protein
MATDKQIEANRQNAQKSTGPRTDGGKAASSQNALKHGVLSGKAISSYEDQPAFDALLEQLIQDLEPQSALELTLVERIAILFWREKRLAETEAAGVGRNKKMLEEKHKYVGGEVDGTFPLQDQYLVGRYQGMLTRQVRDTLRDLRDEQERRSQVIEVAGRTVLGGEE